MRVAYVGHDYLANCAAAVLDAGHTITHMYSVPWARYPVPLRIVDVARRAGVPVQMHRLGEGDLARLRAECVDLLICAGYPYRLPVDPGGPRAINVHPSLLPQGRGPRPVEWAILNGLGETGVTVHEVLRAFDAGPILHQKALPIGAAETDLSLALRCRMLAAETLGDVLRDFEAMWEGRRPQEGGTYDRALRPADRTIRWQRPIDELDRVVRAFTHARLLATIEGKRVVLHEATTWREPHSYAAGSVIARQGHGLLIAAPGGFVFARRTTPWWRIRLQRFPGRVRSRLAGFASGRH